MTRLTELPNQVTAPAPDDRLYIVDVSDPTEGPGGTSGYTTPAALLQNVAWTFPSRSAAAAATIPASVTRFEAGGLGYVADPAGTALTTADGRTWSPDGHATYEHWGAVGNNSADDTAALRAAHDWCMVTEVPLRPIARTYRVTGTIIDYDVVRDGTGRQLNLVGEGPDRTRINIAANLPDFLIKIVGDTTASGQPHAKFWRLEDFNIISNGQVTADIFRIDCADQVDIVNVAVHNCRGWVIFAREWWDSDCNMVITRCGDDGLGPNSGGNGIVPVPAFQKEAIHLDFYFAGNIGDSGTNNIFFPKSFQLAAARHVSVYWGPGTRKCMLNGKVHGDPGAVIDVPLMILDGARQNYIIGANMTEADNSAIRIVNTRNYVPVENAIIGCTLDADGTEAVYIEDGRRNLVIGNLFDSPQAGARVVSGLANIIHSNTIWGGGVEAIVEAAGAVEPLRVHADLEVTAPGSALVLTSPSGTRHRLTVTNTGILQIEGRNV